MTSGTTRTSENYVVTVSGGVFEAPPPPAPEGPRPRFPSCEKCGHHQEVRPWSGLGCTTSAGVYDRCLKCGDKVWLIKLPPAPEAKCWNLPR